MSRRLWSGVVACAISVMAILAGCSFSGSVTSGASAQGATAASGAPIRVGFICSCAGVDAAAASQTQPAMEAWAGWVNATGGINGHPVKLFVVDDNGNLTQGLQGVTQLVEQDKVIAIVGMNSITDADWASYVESKGIPVLGGSADEPSFGTNPDFFPTGAGTGVQVAGFLAAARAAGKRSVGYVICEGAPVCSAGVQSAHAAATALGMDFHSIPISATAPNYYAQCLELKNDGVDAMTVGDTAPIAVKVAADCANVGFEPFKIGELPTFGPQTLADPSWNGSQWSASDAIYSDLSVPSVKQFTDILNEYVPGVTKSSAFGDEVIQS
jgi:branched-chain amino acid transport system substrate-binding protein